MKKILIVNTVGYNYDGMTSVILNYLSAMERQDLKFYFCVYENINPALKEQLEQLGDTVVIPNRKKNVVCYVRTLMRLLRSHMDVIHVHGNSGTMLIEVLLAKWCGVKKIIVHGHNTKTNYPMVNAVLKVPMMYLADICMACSKAAGEWLYGNHPYIVLNNAIDLSRFQFSAESRKIYRDEFGVKDEFLIGHIGHFTPQKNHFFLIEVFYEFHKLEPASKLLLISDGPRFEQVKAIVQERGLQDSVIFAGRRKDVADIYSAMDMFLLPSCWEGLPLTMVEAQVNGLPLLVSDVITEDAKCIDRVYYKALSDGAKSWAEKILQIQNQYCDRGADTHTAIMENGFDIYQEAEKLRHIYLNKKE